QHSTKTSRITKLDTETRTYMERGYSEDFRTVKLVVRPDSSRSNGPIAFAVGERIVVSRAWYRPETHLGRSILAHELAHIVHKRRGVGRPVASGSLVEAEAHAAAATVMAGGRFNCVFADHPARPPVD